MSKPGQTAITGVGHTAFTKASGRTILALCAEACERAIADAGLTPADIDGLASFTVDDNSELLLQQSLGLPELKWTSRAPFGGAGAYVTFQMAAAAVANGAASNVLIFRAFNERSEARYGQPGSYGTMDGPQRDLHRSYGLLTPAQTYGLWYRPYLERYGVTSEDLGRCVVQIRDYAATNPLAWFYERPMTLEQHQDSRWIVEPVLRKLDCCQESDGGAAFVVSSLDQARRSGRPVIRLLAASQLWPSRSEIMYNFYSPDPVRPCGTDRLAAELWKASGVSRNDVDVMTIYDNFTPTMHMTLEEFGFCGPGEAKDLINSGGIGLDGTIPVNTNGGLMGEAYIHGLNNALEAVRQLRGVAANQVKDAQVALVTGTNCGMVLARE